MRKQAEGVLRAVSNWHVILKRDMHHLEPFSHIVRHKSTGKNRSLQLSVLFLLATAVPLSIMAQGAYPPDGSTIPTVDGRVKACGLPSVRARRSIWKPAKERQVKS